jgi:DNA-binding helix-hairpin-helix protein with protein kinase domain
VLNKIINELNVTKIDPSTKVNFAWPNAIGRAPKIGVRMDNVNAQIEHKQLTWWLGARSIKRLKDDIRGDWMDRVRVASTMARIASKLHLTGLCHSDFSGDNFLVNVARRRVVLIDLDSLVVPGVLPPEMLGTGDYMAPEIVIARANGKNDVLPSVDTDKHSLAVLIYQLLLMRHPLKGPKQHDPDPERDDFLALGERALYTEHPEDTSNRPHEQFNGAYLLGEEVENLMRRAFTVGLRSKYQRPSASEWGDALVRMADQIIPCANVNCTGKAFVLLKDRQAVCPWCGTKVARPSTVPVLRLYYGVGQAGHYQADKGRVVGWEEKMLHRWHIQTSVTESSANNPDERRPLAKFSFTGREWRMMNMGIPGLRVATGGSVRPVEINDTFPLENGQQLILGAEKDSRLALVTMQSL